MRSVTLHPRLRACLGASFIIIGSVFAFLLLADAAKGRLSWDKVELGVKTMCFIGSAMGLFIYGIGWAFATTVNDKGLRGPNIFGARRTISWNDIGAVRRVVVKGLPYLLVQSRSRKKEIWGCVLGFNESSILQRLQHFVDASDPSMLKNDAE